MNQCPTCGSTFSEDKVFCPNCGVKLVKMQPEVQKPVKGTLPQSTTRPQTSSVPEKKQHKKSGKMSGIVAVILFLIAAAAVLTAFYFYNEANDYQFNYQLMKWELSTAKSKLENAESELEAYTYYKDIYEAAEKELSTTKAVLEMTEGELIKLGELVGVYGYGSENYYAEKAAVVLKKSESRKLTIYATYQSSYTCTLRASDAGISCGWDGQFSGGKATVTITGKSEGFYTILFTNDQGSDSFELLVVVR